MIRSPDEIRNALRDRLFGKNIVQNNYRGEMIEQVVAFAIESEWKHCSGDWSSWDFRRGRQLVQVKQAAARQSWDRDAEPVPYRSPTFSIRPNSGYYIGSTWRGLKKPERLAQVYIFAWHDDVTVLANHFDFVRWAFYVVSTNILNGLDPKDGKAPKGAITVPQLDILVSENKIKKVSIGELLPALNEVAIACGQSELPLDWSNPD